MPDEKPAPPEDESDDDLSLAEAADADEPSGPALIGSGGLLAQGRGLLALGLALPPPPVTAESLDVAMGRLWLDLLDYGKRHPSKRVRLAANLVSAARILLKESVGSEHSPLGRDATRLSSGAKAYVEASGEVWFTTKRNDGVQIAVEMLQRGLSLEEKIFREKVEHLPGIGDDVVPIRIALLAGIIHTAWSLDDWSWLLELLREKRQPSECPTGPILVKELRKPLRDKKREEWPGLVRNILAAALRAAGVDGGVADTLALRTDR